ncbi:hypothetical protein BJ165DRAFT_1607047 [Panaeolus papilionaceus]|nr:hypothetical protein BJ165DRAFT_1607047 [Panaeolus papilionaceus]
MRVGSMAASMSVTFSWTFLPRHPDPPYAAYPSQDMKTTGPMRKVVKIIQLPRMPPSGPDALIPSYFGTFPACSLKCSTSSDLAEPTSRRRSLKMQLYAQGIDDTAMMSFHSSR